MISVSEAMAIVQQHTPPPEEELVFLPLATGRTLAKDVHAREPGPRYTNSAMDGYAANWNDLVAVAGGMPVSLAIVGESRAGLPFANDIGSGQSVRISTGAMLPDGSDTVIPIEDCERDDEGKVTVLRVTRKEQHVRFRGEEFPSGALLLQRGMALDPARIALLASQGRTVVWVRRRPTVSIFATGTELAGYDQPVEPHQIRDCNSIMLEAAVNLAGGEVIVNERVDDQPDITLAAINRARKQSGIIIFSGGVSVGNHDHVKKAAVAAGFTTLFWKVSQKPGKPLFFAKNGDTLLFGLPGNPVSALMSFVIYIHPLLSGKAPDHRQLLVTGQLGAELVNTGKRPEFFRASLHHEPNRVPRIDVLPQQGSHMMTSMALADGFFLMEPGEYLPAGTERDVRLFPWRA